MFWVFSILNIGCLVVLRLGLFALQRLYCGSGVVALGRPALCYGYLLFWCFALPWWLCVFSVQQAPVSACFPVLLLVLFLFLDSLDS